MTTTFIVSDTHFRHRQEFIWKQRGFNCLEDHDETLISNWNSIITNNDTVIHCGDVCFQPNISIDLILPRLNGNKILILGNHDGNKKLLTYFTKIYSSMEFGRHAENSEFIFSHIPLHISQMNGRWTKATNIHGHLHHEEDLGNKYFNVNLEFHNLKPLSIEDLRIKIRNRNEETGNYPKN